MRVSHWEWEEALKQYFIIWGTSFLLFHCVTVLEHIPLSSFVSKVEEPIWERHRELASSLRV